MLKVLQDNPYRFLGVCSNSPTKDRVANTNRLKAYLKVGKNVDFPIDLAGSLGNINRTLEKLDNANNSINLPKDQLKYALFWFISVTSIDKMAIEYLQSGNSVKAKELFNKRDDFSSLLNRGVLSMIEDNMEDAIKSISTLIHGEEYRDSFVNAICGSTFSIEEDELSQLFIDTLLDEVPARRLKELFFDYGKSSEDDDYLNEKAVREPIESIKSAIAEAKQIDREDAYAQYDAGIKLMNSTKKDLQEVRSILGSDGMEYQMLADNLAKQILQCGINYYNNTDEDDEDSVDKAMALQDYALSIAVGKMTKDRCKENCDILKKKKANLPPSIVKNEVRQIQQCLSSFSKKPEKICHSEELLNNAKPHLESMKKKLGKTDPFYLKISTLVVSNALHNIIEEVNRTQSAIGFYHSEPELLLAGLMVNKKVFDEAWQVLSMMDYYDMESNFRLKRFSDNKKSLHEMREQIDQILSRATNSRYSSSGSSSSDDNNSWGCLIAIAILIFFICLSQCH